MNDKIQKEKEFHDKRFGGTDLRKKLSKFYAVKKHADDFFNQQITSKCNNKTLLEYGCAFGNSSNTYLEAGALLTGIDISPAGIKRANEAASKNGYTNANYLVMNAEEMTFEKGTFDLCVGSGILHHLDLDKSLSEISNALKPNGSAVFIEPLGHNPIINWYRNRTPSMRTDDEHPLLLNDIELMKAYFKDVKTNYFALTTLAASPFVNSSKFGIIYSALQKLDTLLFKIPFIKKNAWTVVVEMSNPIEK